MNIEKNGTVYTVKENKASWTVSTSIGVIFVSYNVKKSDCPTLDAVKKFINENEIF